MVPERKKCGRVSEKLTTTVYEMSSEAILGVRYEEAVPEYDRPWTVVLGLRMTDYSMTIRRPVAFLRWKLKSFLA